MARSIVVVTHDFSTLHVLVKFIRGLNLLRLSLVFLIFFSGTFFIICAQRAASDEDADCEVAAEFKLSFIGKVTYLQHQSVSLAPASA